MLIHSSKSGDKMDVIIGISTGGLLHLQSEVCISSLGDINGDNFWNILDVVTLANCVLSSTCHEFNYACAGDLNEDGGWNVLDVVNLVNCVLASNCDSL